MFADAPHTDGKKFFYPGETANRGLADLIKWKMTSRAAPWPARVDIAPIALPPPPAHDGVVATWVGHSSFVLRSASATILTDPIFSHRAGPLPWLGVARTVPPAFALEALPTVDLVLLSHDHYDHLDFPTLRRVALRDNPLVIAPLGHRSLLAKAGYTRITELDWWATHRAPPAMDITLVPARHWSRRRPFGTNSRLWGGYMINVGARRVYFAGDSGYDPTLFREIGRRCGAPDLALIPIGAYEPRWFMSPSHMNPEEAVRAHRDLGARRSIAMHWGTFQLTDEGREEPVRALEAARGGDTTFAVILPGESTAV